VKVFSDLLRYRVSNARWLEPLPLPEPNHETPPTPVYAASRFLLVSDVRKVWLLDPDRPGFTAMAPLPEAALVDRFFSIGGLIVGAGGENALEGPRRRSEWTFIGRVRSAGTGE
jgi:hypothetical protein